jgi:hypothetical protein
VGNTNSGTTARDCVGVKEGNAAWDYDEGLPTGFWIQFENTSLTIPDGTGGWNGTSVLFYESSTDVKTVLATWSFDTLNWDSDTQNLAPVLDLTLDISSTSYSLTIDGDTISNVTGSLSGTFAAAGITNELTTGYATAYIQSENPGIDISIDQIIITEGAAGSELASLPSPADEAIDIPRDVPLSWTPGEYADTHNVYFGNDFDNVNEADTDSPLLISPAQDANYYNPGRLEFAQTYYWRVDEINAPPDDTVFKGSTWSFTVEAYAIAMSGENITVTASSQDEIAVPENTINGSGLDENDLHSAIPEDMWLSSAGDPGSAWIQYEFNKPYKLYEMLVWNFNGDSILSYYGIKEVTIEYSADNITMMQADISELAQASGAAGYAANTIVPFDGKEVKYVKITADNNWMGGAGIFNQYGLSEVRFMTIPVRARIPYPDYGATDVDVDVTLSWRAGREADEHHVYISTDRQAVEDGTAPMDAVSQASCGPLSLVLDSTYYWRVDEVNAAEVWPGDIWSFSTQEYLVVDDFESYNDIALGEEGSNLVYETWIDGYNNPSTNGATMGYVVAYEPSMESDTIYGGEQSAPLIYDNTTASKSEVTVSTSKLSISSDWTVGGAQALVLWFYGNPNNAVTEQMYVKINNVKVLYDGEAINIARRRWNQWNIDLASLGTNLSNVSTFTIGFERTGATGGSGIIFIDDIRLYTIPPAITEPIDPGKDALVAHYAFENNTEDSSGNNLNGTAVGNTNFVAGAMGFAIEFDGVDGYVDCGNSASFDITEEITLSAWVNTSDSGNSEHNPFISKGDHTYAIKHSIDNNIQFFIYDGGWFTANSGVDSSFDGDWHHVVGTYDGSELKIYVDSVLKTTTTHEGTISTASNNLAIGTNTEETDRFYEGVIDEVRIYNRALSAAEILYITGQ